MCEYRKNKNGGRVNMNYVLTRITRKSWKLDFSGYFKIVTSPKHSY